MKDPVSRRSRGFGFITFEHSSYVDNVLAQDVHTIDSRKVEAKRAVPRNEVSRDPPPAKMSTTHPVVAPTVNSPSTGHAATGNGDDYAFCKIFVGGLHYDTRDGTDMSGYVYTDIPYPPRQPLRCADISCGQGSSATTSRSMEGSCRQRLCSIEKLTNLEGLASLCSRARPVLMPFVQRGSIS